MSVQLNPYINFKNNAREAMEFYQSVFGGKLEIHTFKEFHASQDPSEDDMIMHATLEGDNGLILMGADTPSRAEFTPGNTMSVSLSGDDDAALSGYFEKLAAGGTVTVPLEKSDWGDQFGMCIDRFGTQWMVNIAGK